MALKLHKTPFATINHFRSKMLRLMVYSQSKHCYEVHEVSQWSRRHEVMPQWCYDQDIKQVLKSKMKWVSSSSYDEILSQKAFPGSLKYIQSLWKASDLEWMRKGLGNWWFWVFCKKSTIWQISHRLATFKSISIIRQHISDIIWHSNWKIWRLISQFFFEN